MKVSMLLVVVDSSMQTPFGFTKKSFAQRIVDEAARQGVAISKPTLSEKIKVRIDSTKIRVEKAATRSWR